MVNAISEWLSDNQLLVFSLIVPAFSAVVAWVSSLISVRRALRSEKERREHEVLTQISVFRQNWINSLRDTMAEWQAVAILPGKDPKENENFYRLGTKIELLMNPGDEDYKQLQEKMYAFYHVEADHKKEELDRPYVNVCQRILKREWDRLKDELKDPKKFTSP